jgi:outer membrane receptor protein involved in Fe transport
VRRSHSRWLWAIAVAGVPGAVRAGGDEAGPTQLQSIVVTGSRVVEDVDSATEATIDSAQLQSRPLTRPAELLEVVPGLIVAQHSGEGKANQYFLRGFNLDHGTDFATFVDDMPVNLRTHAHGQGYSDLNFMIPELVDSIQYRKGPYYAQYGDFSAAGAADIRYKEAFEAPLIEVTGGEYGYARLVAAASHAAFGGQLLYGVEGLHYDGPFVNDGNFNKGSGVLRYSHHGDGGDYRLELMAYQAHWDATDQIPQRAVDEGLVTEYGCIDCTDAGSTYRYSLSGGFDHRLGDGTLSASAFAIRYHLNLYSDFTYYLNADNIDSLADKSFEPDKTRPTDQFEQLDTRNLYGGQLKYSFATPLAGLPFANEIGLQTRLDHIEPVGLYDTQARNRFYTVLQDRVDEWSGAAYAQSAVRVTPWARAIFGLRYDQYRFRVDSSVAGNSGTASAGIASPKLSLVFGPFQKTEFFVNLGKGFHSNDARGVTQHVNPASAASPSATAAEPATPLAAARGADIGLRTAIVQHLQISVSLFVLDLDSELTLDGDDGTTGIGAATRREGVETAVVWRPLHHLVIDSDYAYAHARYRGSGGAGTHIEEAPAGVAALGATYTDPRGWDSEVRLRYFGPRPLTEDASVSSHATTLVNAGFGYRFADRWRIAFEGTNLLNSRDHDVDYYYSSRLPGEPAQGIDDIHFHPVEPRNGRLSVTYTY